MQARAHGWPGGGLFRKIHLKLYIDTFPTMLTWKKKSSVKNHILTLNFTTWGLYRWQKRSEMTNIIVPFKTEVIFKLQLTEHWVIKLWRIVFTWVERAKLIVSELTLWQKYLHFSTISQLWLTNSLKRSDRKIRDSPLSQNSHRSHKHKICI